MLTEKTFDTGEVTISYAEGPAAGPPLLLLHGLSSRWQSFLSLIPVLSLRWHVFAPDLRGHGLSGRAANRYTLEDYVGDTLRFMARHFDEPPALYGHSLGGMVGIMIAARRPLRALVIGDSPLYLDTIQTMYGASPKANPVQQLIRSERNVARLSAALHDLMPNKDQTFYRYHAKNLSLLDAGVLTPLLTILDGYDCATLLPKIRCPALILRADHITQEDAQRAQAQLADATVISFEGLGHELQNDGQGYAVTLAVAKFLESL